MSRPSRAVSLTEAALPLLLSLPFVIGIPAAALAYQAWGTNNQALFLIAAALFVLPIALLMLAISVLHLEERSWWKEFHAELNDPLHITTFDWDNFENEFWAHVEQPR